MMCDPCFMDANQVGFVHELSMEDIQEILDNAISIKPRRQMSVQFSGGEPTISPHLLEAIRYSRNVGYNSVQAATNGIEFAKSKEFCQQAAEAGLRYVYFQFDGIGNDANSHRQVGNLFDVKLRAINNLHEAGVEIVLVTTLVNGINNDQVGSIIRFALDNPKKIAFLSFQPVSFTGRDEAITPERRLQQRYTLSHLAHDVKNQVGITEPTRDWFPLSLMGAFADFADLVHGPQSEWGQVSCGCHPNCGVGTAVMIDKETKEMSPVPAFLDIPGLVRDIRKITDGWRNLIEHMHQNETVGKWYEEHGRHEIFAGGKEVQLTDPTHNLKLNESDLARPNKPHMEGPKTAHEEMVAMRKLYQEMVLKQQEIKSDNGDKPVQIQGLSRKKDLAVVSA